MDQTLLSDVITLRQQRFVKIKQSQCEIKMKGGEGEVGELR